MSGRRGSFLLHNVLQNTFLLVGLGAVTGVVVVLTFGLTAPVLRGFAVAAIAAPVVVAPAAPPVLPVAARHGPRNRVAARNHAATQKHLERMSRGKRP